MQLAFVVCAHWLLVATAAASTNLDVDLGYQVYRGFYNATSGLNNWLGIRFAASPTGLLRWQAPQPPPAASSHNRSAQNATSYAPFCPQNPPGSPTITAASLAAMNVGAAEDCLFLNVQAPAGGVAGRLLPVLVWIHGGGYGAGTGRQDFSSILAANNNSFVAVSIQYRLGAFGFLASDEVYRKGVVNAGILDQQFALEWVQKYISLFGGNASHVTISGESVSNSIE